VWKYISDEDNLNRAHASLVNVKAQTDVFLHPSVVPYIDRKASIQPIDLIFTATEQDTMRRTMEPMRPVHALSIHCAFIIIQTSSKIYKVILL